MDHSLNDQLINHPLAPALGSSVERGWTVCGGQWSVGFTCNLWRLQFGYKICFNVPFTICMIYVYIYIYIYIYDMVIAISYFGDTVLKPCILDAWLSFGRKPHGNQSPVSEFSSQVGIPEGRQHRHSPTLVAIWEGHAPCLSDCHGNHPPADLLQLDQEWRGAMTCSFSNSCLFKGSPKASPRQVCSSLLHHFFESNPSGTKVQYLFNHHKSRSVL